MPSKMVVLWEKQIALLKIRSWVAKSTSNENKHYATSLSLGRMQKF